MSAWGQGAALRRDSVLSTVQSHGATQRRADYISVTAERRAPRWQRPSPRRHRALTSRQPRTLSEDCDLPVPTDPPRGKDSVTRAPQRRRGREGRGQVACGAVWQPLQSLPRGGPLGFLLSKIANLCFLDGCGGQLAGARCILPSRSANAHSQGRGSLSKLKNGTARPLHFCPTHECPLCKCYIFGCVSSFPQIWQTP